MEIKVNSFETIILIYNNCMNIIIHTGNSIIPKECRSQDYVLLGRQPG